MRVVPCLDVRSGRVVKGVAFKELADQGDPAGLAGAYQAQGADEVVMLDVSATSEGRSARLDTVRAVRRRLSVPLTVGGGVGSVDQAATLLEAGADKIAVNTEAVRRPDLLSELAGRFGRQCVVVAVDAAAVDEGHEVVVRSGTRPVGLDAATWARTAVQAGAGEILLTSVDRDGTRQGYDLDLVRRVRAVAPVPIVASGGAESPSHMADAVEAGADAVLAASIFHQARWTVDGVKRALRELGLPVRPRFGEATGLDAQPATP